MALWSQRHKQQSTSRSLVLLYENNWWEIHRQCYHWEDYATSFGYFSSWPSGETLRIPQGEKVIECSIRSYAPVVAVTEQKAVLSIELFDAEENFEWENVRYTSLTTTISHDNNNHRTSKHASTSWRSDGSPSCFGGSSHRWVPIKTHSTSFPFRWRDCGLLTNSTTHNNEPKKTQHDNNRERGGGHHVVFSRKISRMDQKKTMHFVRLQKLVVIFTWWTCLGEFVWSICEQVCTHEARDDLKSLRHCTEKGAEKLANMRTVNNTQGSDSSWRKL